MREEALHTTDKYTARLWLEDKGSALWKRPVLFVEAGVLTNKLFTKDDESANSSDAMEDLDVEKVTNDFGHKDYKITALPPTEAPSPLEEDSGRVEELLPNELYELPVRINLRHISISYQDGGSITSSPDSSSIPKGKPIADPVLRYSPLRTQIISQSEENIVFSPRRRGSKPSSATQTPPLSKHDDLQTLPSQSPKLAQIQNRSMRRERHKLSVTEDDSADFESPLMGSAATVAIDEALQDYMENIRRQEETDGDESPLDKALRDERSELNKLKNVSEENHAVELMKSLSLEDAPDQAKLAEPRDILKREPVQKDFSESTSPLGTGITETPGIAALVTGTHTNSDILEGAVTKDDNASILNTEEKSARSGRASSESSDSDGQESLGDPSDPLWWVDTNPTPRAEENELILEEDRKDQDDEEVGSEDEDEDEDEELLEDEAIIANMILDDYDLSDLDLDLIPPPNGFKKSITRQPNVLPLPSANEDIASHLQTVWQNDRETKKNRKAERERARLLGLLGDKPKGKGKRERREVRQEELLRNLPDEGGLEVDIRKINDEMRAFWEDKSLLEYVPFKIYSGSIILIAKVTHCHLWTD
jgi:hypothetical protein